MKEINILDSKFKLTKDIAQKLSILGGRTGLPHNILCRYAFSLSLNEDMAPQLIEQEKHEKEIARHTLTGDYDLTMRALLQFRLSEWNINEYSSSQFNEYFQNNIYRGVEMVYARVKNLMELCELLT